jgi:hypothetical protein
MGAGCGARNRRMTNFRKLVDGVMGAARRVLDGDCPLGTGAQQTFSDMFHEFLPDREVKGRPALAR